MIGLRQKISDKAVVGGEKLAAVFRELPTGHIGREAVHDSQVELFGQGLKQVEIGRMYNLLDGLVDVAHKSQAGIGYRLHAARKSPVGHKVLHDLHGIGVSDRDAAYLVEGNGIPETHQTHLFPRRVVK